MKDKIKKIITTTIVSAVSLTAIGCASNNSKIAKKINNSMDDFVSSINNLDYVETTSAKAPSSNNIGKIIETSSNNNSMEIRTSGNHVQFLNNNITEAEIENTITIPSKRTDNFNLFILSTTPFITLSNDDENSLNINVKFSTNQIEETSNEIESKINALILKRSILMIYVNEIFNGNVDLSEDNKLAINAYVNVIKENTSFLNGNRGMVKNQLSLASDLISSESNDNLINYYIIKSGEALETRANKIDSTIAAIDSIIAIIEANLINTSTYYETNLSGTYENLISNINNSETSQEITSTSSNKEIANKIACSLNFCNNNLPQTNENKTLVSNNNKKTNQLDIKSNSNSNKNSQNQLNNQQNNIQRKKSNQYITNENNEINSQTSYKNHNYHKTNINDNKQQNQQTNNLNNNIQNNTNNINFIKNRKYHNNSIESIKNQDNKSSYNNLSRRNKMNDNNDITMRAKRTPENLTKEEYMQSSNNHEEIQRATRVPYKTTSINSIR